MGCCQSVIRVEQDMPLKKDTDNHVRNNINNTGTTTEDIMMDVDEPASPVRTIAAGFSESSTTQGNNMNNIVIAGANPMLQSFSLQSEDALVKMRKNPRRSVSFAKEAKETSPLLLLTKEASSLHEHNMIRAPSGINSSPRNFSMNTDEIDNKDVAAGMLALEPTSSVSSPEQKASDESPGKYVAPLPSDSERKRHQRHESRRSIKSDIELKAARGEEFWKDMLPEPKKENIVVLSSDAQEAEDSKQEIGFVNQYTFVRNLGEGSSAEVKLAINENDKKFYAIKILSRRIQKKRVSLSRKGNTRLSFFNGLPQEVAILKRITHQNIVNLYEVIDDPRIDRLYLVFEYVPGKQFPSSVKLEPLPGSTIRKYVREIASGLRYCHDEGVCHGDIKPENLLVTPEDHIKISDFGVSYLVTDAVSRKRAGMGTPLFTAPESISAEGKFKAQPLDIWALGITLFVFVFGSCPFVAESVIDTFEMIKTQELSFPEPIEPELEDLLRKLLEKDPEKRITLAEMFEHPWITKDGPMPVPIIPESASSANNAADTPEEMSS